MGEKAHLRSAPLLERSSKRSCLRVWTKAVSLPKRAQSSELPLDRHQRAPRVGDRGMVCNIAISKYSNDLERELSAVVREKDYYFTHLERELSVVRKKDYYFTHSFKHGLLPCYRKCLSTLKTSPPHYRYCI